MLNPCWTEWTLRMEPYWETLPGGYGKKILKAKFSDVMDRIGRYIRVHMPFAFGLSNLNHSERKIFYKITLGRCWDYDIGVNWESGGYESVPWYLSIYETDNIYWLDNE